MSWCGVANTGSSPQYAELRARVGCSKRRPSDHFGLSPISSQSSSSGATGSHANGRLPEHQSRGSPSSPGARRWPTATVAPSNSPVIQGSAAVGPRRRTLGRLPDPPARPPRLRVMSRASGGAACGEKMTPHVQGDITGARGDVCDNGGSGRRARLIRGRSKKVTVCVGGAPGSASASSSVIMLPQHPVLRQARVPARLEPCAAGQRRR